MPRKGKVKGLAFITYVRPSIHFQIEQRDAREGRVDCRPCFAGPEPVCGCGLPCGCAVLPRAGEQPGRRGRGRGRHGGGGGWRLVLHAGVRTQASTRRCTSAASRKKCPVVRTVDRGPHTRIHTVLTQHTRELRRPTAIMPLPTVLGDNECLPTRLPTVHVETHTHSRPRVYMWTMCSVGWKECGSD